ncbi:MAG: glycosyltransferase [Pseudomonadota bacterium]
MIEHLNVVFVGSFPYPHGMAGTKRIQHAIDFFREQGVYTSVLVLRQSSLNNPLSGIYNGTPYETAVGDVNGRTLLMALPKLYFKAMSFFRRNRLSEGKNIIYNYGPLALENWLPLYYAKYLGYKIVFDIVEDYDVAHITAHSFLQRMSIGFVNRISNKMKHLASGIIVISSHLEKKYHELMQGKVPVHYRPISVKMDCFPDRPTSAKETVSLFYAGSFGKKDGLIFLLEAFERLAAKNANLRLILTGRGDSESTKTFLSRLEVSPFKDKIEYKGYLDDDSYYAVLSSADILCMTRIDMPYAHAGFPFKLGEYLASGKPVIASRVSDVDNFIVDRQSAMLVKPGHSQDIVEAAEYLIENRDVAAIIGLRGREVARSNFEYRNQGQKFLSYLRKI